MLTLALLAPTAVAGADTLTVDDATGDVRTSETEVVADEPRVDITAVEVINEARRLRVAVTVAQVTPLNDDAWESLALEVALVDDRDQPWFWSFVPDGGGGASGMLVSFTDAGVSTCDTTATASEVRDQYVLTAGAECLRGLSPQVRVGVAMSYDPDPLDDDFDVTFDVAPDDDVTAPIGTGDGPVVTRLAGDDRIETAIVLSGDRFDGGAAPAAVLAASAAEDAATAGPLAAWEGGPLLLTGGDRLDERVADELLRAVAPGGEVLLVGGTGALSEAVVTEVRALGLRPRRLAGVDRFATAVAVAEHMGDHAITIVADARRRGEGQVAGAAAAALGGVVVLSDGATLPAVTEDFLAADAVRHVAVGAAAAAAPGAERITAASTAELSQLVLDRLLPDVRTIAVATVGSADALAGAPHIAAWQGGLLLTDASALSPAVAAELEQRADALREVVLYGGTGTLSAGVAAAITDAVR